MLEGIVFAAGTLGLALVSHASLRNPKSHGFYRFIAWECMLAVFVLDLRYWYADMYAPHQIIAGVLFFISLLLVLFGMMLLQKLGKPSSNRDDTPMLGFEKTTTLVTTGIFRYIRHPMYASLILLCWGLFFKMPTLTGGMLAATASIFLLITARVEEMECTRYFGPAYQEYKKNSNMFVPFIW